MEIKDQTSPDAIIVCAFNTPHTPIDRLFNKETAELNCTIDLMDLTDIYRILHTTVEEYTFLSTVHETFSKIDHI
jgi:hypothetical protein